MSEQDRTARQPGRLDPPVEAPEESLPVEQPSEPAEEWPVRRALIRATLTLPEGAPAVQRQAPVFTMHQQTRGGNGGNGADGNQANGNVRSSRSAWDNGQPNKPNDKKNSSRSPRRNDRGGQTRGGSASRSASSRRGRGRSR